MGCEKGLQWEKSLSLLGDMRLCVAEPNVLTCNAAVSALARGRRWHLAVWLLSQVTDHASGMRYRGLDAAQPNMITFNSILEVCESGAQAASMPHALESITNLGFELLRSRQGVWLFRNSHTNYPGHAVMMMDWLHWHDCLDA